MMPKIAGLLSARTDSAGGAHATARAEPDQHIAAIPPALFQLRGAHVACLHRPSAGERPRPTHVPVRIVRTIRPHRRPIEIVTRVRQLAADALGDSAGSETECQFSPGKQIRVVTQATSSTPNASARDATARLPPDRAARHCPATPLVPTQHRRAARCAPAPSSRCRGTPQPGAAERNGKIARPFPHSSQLSRSIFGSIAPILPRGNPGAAPAAESRLPSGRIRGIESSCHRSPALPAAPGSVEPCPCHVGFTPPTPDASP